MSQTPYSAVIFLDDAIATQKLGRILGKSLPAGSTILLEGDLGSGKTTLVQGIGQGLGIEEPIVSPTFTIINEYPEGRLPLYHLDLYRLPPSEIPEIQPELYWEGVEVVPGITAIEWAERLPYKPLSYIKIGLFCASTSDRRQASIETVGKMALDFSICLDE